MIVNHPQRNISIPLPKTLLHEQGMEALTGVFFYRWLF
jgi:hypothetical protein